MFRCSSVQGVQGVWGSGVQGSRSLGFMVFRCLGLDENSLDENVIRTRFWMKVSWMKLSSVHG